MDSARLTLRHASPNDIDLLASFNHRLIRDEGHRNSMNEVQLAARMRSWIGAEYAAVLFDHNAETVGYALYREDSDAIYLRQFFIERGRRRQGYGRDAFTLLAAELKHRKPMIRLEVLTTNEIGIAFWQSLGFKDYCITMELAH